GPTSKTAVVPVRPRRIRARRGSLAGPPPGSRTAAGRSVSGVSAAHALLPAPRAALCAARPASAGFGDQHRHHGVSDPTSRSTNRPWRVRGSLTPWLAVPVTRSVPVPILAPCPPLRAADASADRGQLL